MTARITVTGNAATAPLVRITRTGRKVANFRIGSTERYQDRASGEWVDGNTFFVSVACWGALADNVEVSVKLGMALVVTGKISQRTYTDNNDKTQFAYEIQAESVAPDLNRGTVVYTRVNRSTGPTAAVDENGEPVLGVADSPFERVGAPSEPDGGFSINPDGSFGQPTGLDLEGGPDGPDETDADRRTAAALVGAGT